MPSEIDDLLATRANLIATLRVESASPKPSYSINGQSVDWNGYRASLMQQIESINQMIAAIEGPWEVVHEGIV